MKPKEAKERFTIEIVSRRESRTQHIANFDFNYYGSFDSEAAAEGILVEKRWLPCPKMKGNSWVGCLSVTPKVAKTATTPEVPEQVEIAYASIVPVVTLVSFADPIDLPKALGKVPQLKAVAA